MEIASVDIKANQKNTPRIYIMTAKYLKETTGFTY